MAERSERCSTPRWKPTTEQLEILEELYKKGSQSPDTEQIHHIADFLTRYGEIQAKNVFYWFQNRKGGDRLSKRRRLDEAMGSVCSKPPHTKTARIINRNLKKRGWAMARIATRLEEVARPLQSAQFQECEPVNDALQTLQLFPLMPTNIGCKNH